MANATNSSPGEIQLAGDLAGNNDATAPELSTIAGLTPGSYDRVSLTVDAKGRVIDVTENSAADITALISDATTTNKGIVEIGANIDVSAGVISVPEATDTTLGVAQAGNGISVSSGVFSINTNEILADGDTTYGVVRSADTNNIVISSGEIDIGPNVLVENEEITFSAGVHTTIVTLTDAASISVDASLGNIFEVTLQGDRTLQTPTNLEPGFYTFIINQDATGGHTLDFDTEYYFKFGSDTLIYTNPNDTTIVSCVSDGTNMYCSMAGGWQ